jgi:hypothetical protein
MSSDSPLSALERSMGLASVGASPAVFSPGELESDPEATPPAGRRAVHYGSPGEDALFEDDAAAADEDPEAASSVLDLMGALGPGGDAGALISQLESMADDFERQSGQPEIEIRSKIAMLRSVIDSRPAAVAQSRDRMHAALQAVDTDAGLPPAAILRSEETALQSLCTDSMRSIEADMNAVGSMLRDDTETAAVVASLVAKK